ncbi:MAG: hypothetical protein PHD84_00005 [Atribacterota bacterium]|nr:hypothetical protein [Atribacterota bacterium]
MVFGGKFSVFSKTVPGVIGWDCFIASLLAITICHASCVLRHLFQYTSIPA